MISSNLLGAGQEAPFEQGSFYEVETSLEDYISRATRAFSDETAPPVESDYFISTARAIENLWSECAAVPSSNWLTKVKTNKYLVRWFSMIVSMILFSGNELKQITLKPEKSGAYVQAWKRKLSCFGGNLDNETGLNVYAFSEDDPSDIVGCCSDRYFVIPPKSHPKSQNLQQWKAFYLEICKSAHNLEDSIKKRCVLERILLFLSAKSMPDIQKSPLGIVKEILLGMNLLTQEQEDYLQSKQILGEKSKRDYFFHVVSEEIPNELLTDSMYLVRKNRMYYALYPMKEEIAEKIEDGSCTVEKMTMSVKESSSIDFTRTWATGISVFRSSDSGLYLREREEMGN